MNFTTSTLKWYRGTEILKRQWSRKDEFEYDSDPDNKHKDGKNHKHKGILFVVNASKGSFGKLMLKDEYGGYCNYGLEVINIKLPQRGKVLQIGKNHYLNHKEFDKNVTDLYVKRKICEIEENAALFDEIILKRIYPKNTLNTLLMVDALEVRMKDTNKWYLEYKYEILCIGYCNQIERKSKMTIPTSIKYIVLNYCFVM